VAAAVAYSQSCRVIDFNHCTTPSHNFIFISTFYTKNLYLLHKKDNIDFLVHLGNCVHFSLIDKVLRIMGFFYVGKQSSALEILHNYISEFYITTVF